MDSADGIGSWSVARSKAEIWSGNARKKNTPTIHGSLDSNIVRSQSIRQATDVQSAGDHGISFLKSFGLWIRNGEQDGSEMNGTMSCSLSTYAESCHVMSSPDCSPARLCRVVRLDVVLAVLPLPILSCVMLGRAAAFEARTKTMLPPMNPATLQFVRQWRHAVTIAANISSVRLWQTACIVSNMLWQPGQSVVR
jgi:hypothetical protein